jgi:SAM-dependent methyltransferase
LDQHEKIVEWQIRSLRRLGAPLNEHSRILDFGCGTGRIVQIYRARGLGAEGFDLADYSEGLRNSDQPEFRFARPKGAGNEVATDSSYRVPWDDATFDLVVSEQVFEHVAELDRTVAELARVTKPGGWGLHLIPARYAPIEGHLFIPFASILPTESYLRIWTAAGWGRQIGPKANGDWRARATAYASYMATSVFYRTEEELAQCFGRHFARVEFADQLFFENWPGGLSKLAPLVRRIAWFGRLHSKLRQYILLVRR